MVLESSGEMNTSMLRMMGSSSSSSASGMIAAELLITDSGRTGDIVVLLGMDGDLLMSAPAIG